MQDQKLFNQLSLVYILSCMDFVITRMSLPLGAIEANPILASIIETHVGALLKLCLPIIILYYIWRRRKSNPLRIYRTALFLTLFYALVVTWNVSVFLFYLT